MRISPVMEIVLEILKGGAETTVVLFDAMTSGYSDSYKKLKRYQRGSFSSKNEWPEKYQESQKFYSLLYNLKKQGLIESKKEGRGSIWRIKPAGKEQLIDIKKRKIFSPSQINYHEESDTLKIIAFDIPAKDDRKRYWLRVTADATFSTKDWTNRSTIHPPAAL